MPPPSQPPAGLVALPGSAGTFGLRAFPATGQPSRWCVFRGWPDERLHVFSNCDSASPRAVPFTRAEQGGLLLIGAGDAGDQLWLLVYDAERNVPSGRTPGTVSDGVDVLLFSSAGDTQPVQVVERMALAAFDVVYTRASTDELTVCSGDRCFFVRADGSVVQRPLSGYEFVEAVVGADAVHAIVRPLDEHVSGNADFQSFHYALASLYPDRTELQPIAAQCIPYSLRVDAGNATWQCARTRSELAALVRFEIARMPNDGMIDFGVSNLEGRVAWSQAYYLNGLMQLGGDALPALKGAGDWTSLRARLRAEVELLAQRAGATDGLVSKRYSMRRTAVTFALHLGRIARILGNAAQTGHGSPQVEQARSVLQAQLRTLHGTVEQPAQAGEDGLTFATLAYARGADFWCDGANVPHNYVSGVVDGMLAANQLTADDLERTAQLMQPLLALEGLDQAADWRYWWARGSNGWSETDDVSVNTPSYVGNPGVAHITYRSMDAIALLWLEARRPGTVPDAVVDNIRALTAAGLLLPWVNQGWPRAEQAVLEPAVTYRYARSAGPWELQSQVWALERLAQDAAP